MRKSGVARSLKRDGVWYMIRRVSKEFSELDKRTIFKISTGSMTLVRFVPRRWSSSLPSSLRRVGKA